MSGERHIADCLCGRPIYYDRVASAATLAVWGAALFCAGLLLGKGRSG